MTNGPPLPDRRYPRWRRWLSVSIAVFGLSTAIARPLATDSRQPPQAAAPPATLAARLDALAQEAIAQGRTPGMSIAIAGDGWRIDKAYGMANLELASPMTPGSVLRIGSITKQFTAASILLLAEQDRLRLDDPLSRYISGFPRGDQVTVRQLLLHTSGIRNFTATEATPAEIFGMGASQERMTTVIGDLGYDFEPGTHFAYSNSGYYLAGLIIERASGQPYAEFVRRHLFEPADMRDTAVDTNEEIVAQRASGYSGVEGAAGKWHNASYTHMSVPFAAGAIRSTASDLIRWNQALEAGKILKPASLQIMRTPSLQPVFRKGADNAADDTAPVRRSHYGMGVAMDDIAGRQAIHHGGAIDGFNAALSWFPGQRINVAVLTNADGGADGLPEKIADLLPPASTDVRTQP